MEIAYKNHAKIAQFVIKKTEVAFCIPTVRKESLFCAFRKIGRILYNTDRKKKQETEEIK